MAELMTTFTINGTLHSVPIEESQLSLVDYIRNKLNLKGTKTMCREGGCGTCTVSINKHDPISGMLKTKAITSCIMPVYQCDGANITTIEKLGNSYSGYHEIQKRLSSYNATQCGFCSPGMVMNLHSVLAENPYPTEQQLEDSLDGNLCRCTGYRPILDAIKSFAKNVHKCPVPDIEDINLNEWSCIPADECGNYSAYDYITESVPKIYRPKQLQKLYTLLGKLSHSRYRLVLGNTGSAVYKTDQVYDALIDVSQVAELYQFSAVSSCPIVLGSNISLNDVASLLKQVAKKESTLAYFEEIANHITKLGNVHIRNMAGWAGNLMLKHEHRHFLSDIFMLFESVQAVLTIRHFSGIEEEVPMQMFLNTDMHGKIIEKVTIPVIEGKCIYKTYKLLPRANNAPAYLSCAFMFDLDTENNYRVNKKPTIIYEGISDTFIHAKNTEQFLIGKELLLPDVLKQAYKVLNEELIPHENPALSSKLFRNTLGKTVFYKFILHLMKDVVSSVYSSGSKSIYRALSHGLRETDTNEERWPITQPIMKIEALKQCTGEVQYCGDIPSTSNQLYAAFVISSVGNAKLKSIDAAEALKLKGVLKFLTAADIPKNGKNTCTASDSPEKQEQLFCTKEVQFAGQPIGLILAKTDHQARLAASKVKVEYFDMKKPRINIIESLADHSFSNDTSKNNHHTFMNTVDDSGDNKSWKNSVRGEVEFGGQYHFFLENHSCICIPTDSGFDVCCSTQAISKVQTVISKVLGISKNKINAKAKLLGGAFGGKLGCSLYAAAACVLAAHVCRQPVRIDVPLDVTMKMLGKRLPYLTKYSVSFTEDGKLTGGYIGYYNDCGILVKSFSAEQAMLIGDNVYESPTWILFPIKVKTNLPANTYFRAPGMLQAVATVETIMDHMAHQLKKDPLEIRITNIAGMKSDLSSSYLGRIIKITLSKSDYYDRRLKIGEYNKKNRWKKRGISFTPLKYPLEYYAIKFNVKVCIYAGDGSITITHGGVEMGQGINTKVAQACAYTLEAPIDKIEIASPNTINCPNNQDTGGSIASDLCCFEAVKCCKILNERMKEVKESLGTQDWELIVNECHRRSIDLSAQSTYTKDDVPFDYDIYATAVSEVEVDILTGETIVQRVDITYDCGQSMNPEIDIGQIEGGFVQGLGLMLTEKLRYHPDTGQNLTHSTWSYYAPTAKDIPVDFRIRTLQKVSNPFGVLSSKATGEPSVCLAGSIILAVRSAVQAARADLGHDEWFMLSAPATPEEILKNCLHNIDNFVLQ